MLQSGRNNFNVRGLRPVKAVNWAFKRCFIRHITRKMTLKTEFLQKYSDISRLIFKRALRAHVYSTKPFGKVLLLCRVAINKCMYVKHIPHHNNLSPTSLLITLTVFVAVFCFHNININNRGTLNIWMNIWFMRSVDEYGQSQAVRPVGGGGGGAQVITHC